MNEIPHPLQSWLDECNTMMEGLYQQGYNHTPEQARMGLANLTSSFVSPGPELASVADGVIPGTGTDIPVRLYHPDGSQALPVVIYLHGGGHMAGSIEVYDPICRRLARSAQQTVLSVDYRLAPEHAFPAGLEDAECVLRNYQKILAGEGLKSSTPVSLAGDSAGGAMAASLAQRFQDRNEVEIDSLILIYPSLDYTSGASSVTNLANGYLLEQEKIEWYFHNYFQKGEDYRKASPLFMEIDKSFARTMIVTAGFCPLCDEGLQFAALLESKGIAVNRLHFPTMVHAFLNLEQLVESECRQTYEAVGAFLNYQK